MTLRSQGLSLFREPTHHASIKAGIDNLQSCHEFVHDRPYISGLSAINNVPEFRIAIEGYTSLFIIICWIVGMIGVIGRFLFEVVQNDIERR